MKDFLKDYKENKDYCCNFPGGNIILDSFCVFTPSAIKMINNSLHIVPSREDIEGWYIDGDQYKTVKRDIASGMIRFLTPCHYGTYSLGIDLKPLDGTNILVGLFSEDNKTRIYLMLFKGNLLLRVSKFYAGTHVNDISSYNYVVLGRLSNTQIKMSWIKNLISISFNDRIIYSSQSSLINQKLYPVIAYNIIKPNISFPFANPLIINKFTYEPYTTEVPEND